MPEGDFAAALSAVADKYAGVAIGSYPQTNRDHTDLWKSKLTFEGADEAAVDAAANDAQRMVAGFSDPQAEQDAGAGSDEESSGGGRPVGMS